MRALLALVQTQSAAWSQEAANIHQRAAHGIPLWRSGQLMYSDPPQKGVATTFWRFKTWVEGGTAWTFRLAAAHGFWHFVAWG